MANEIRKHEILEIDKDVIKRIATRVKELRVKNGYSYEGFALHASINRNTYFKFEKSAKTGENFTITTLLKVLRGLELSLVSFFEDL